MATSKAMMQTEIIRDISNFITYMPNPDEVMQRTGEGLTLYDKMFSDGRVSSLFFARRNATLNLPIYVKHTGNKSVDAFLDEYVTEKQLRKWAWKLHTGALKYGFQPMELVWRRDAGRFVISYLKGHLINSYSFDAKGRLYYTDMTGRILLDQRYKWVIHRHEGDTHDNPMGMSALKSAYWAYKFKQIGMQFWVTATEKFAVPSLLALFEHDSGDQTKITERAQYLADTIEGLQSGSGGAMANVKDIKEISMSGTLKDFEILQSACDVQIAYALTGQSLATNNPDSGSRALGSVHAETMADTVENDARGLAYTLQELVAMVIDLNFGSEIKAPEVEIDTGSDANWQQIAEAIKLGIPVSRSALYSRYRIPEPEDEKDIYTTEELELAGLAPKELEDQGNKTDEGGEKKGADVDKTGAGVQLNGAQVQAAAGIVKSVEAGELPRDSGLAQLRILFNLSEKQAEEMMGTAGKSKKQPESEEDYADPDDGKKKARRNLLIL